MSEHTTIKLEAWESYKILRFREAALLYRRAASIAREFGDQAAWFECTVWAASATVFAGNLPEATALLISARSEEPENAGKHEAWMARKYIFMMTLFSRPELTRLLVLLRDLKTYAAASQVAKGDVPELEGNLQAVRGLWSEAIVSYETAWAVYDGLGFTKSGKAHEAALCALRLGRRSECVEWRGGLARCVEEEEQHAVALAEVDVRLALSREDDHSKLVTLLRTLQDRVASTQDAQAKDVVRDLSTRVSLLDPAGEDPCDSHHLARQELRTRHASQHQASTRQDARLLLLDYRIACLRYTAGVPPVDDYYKTRRSPILTGGTRGPGAQARLRKAQNAARSTLHHAMLMDSLVDSTWYRGEVRRRLRSIQEISLILAVDGEDAG